MLWLLGMPLGGLGRTGLTAGLGCLPRQDPPPAPRPHGTQASHNHLTAYHRPVSLGPSPHPPQGPRQDWHPYHVEVEAATENRDP